MLGQRRTIATIILLVTLCSLQDQYTLAASLAAAAATAAQRRSDQQYSNHHYQQQQEQQEEVFYPHYLENLLGRQYPLRNGVLGVRASVRSLTFQLNYSVYLI